MDSESNRASARPCRSLVIGYGNIDRQDDGVAWHVLTLLLTRLNHGPVDPFEQPLVESNPDLSILFALQLTPEMAEMIAGYDQVCFVDAHTGSAAEPVHIETVTPEMTTSPFTHHLTPATCLYLTQSIFHKDVAGMLVSVQGYEFGFEQSLSTRTSELAALAVEVIFDWINTRKIGDC